jgi:hypothetical protein
MRLYRLAWERDTRFRIRCVDRRCSVAAAEDDNAEVWTVPGPGWCVCFDTGGPCPAAAPVCFAGIAISCTDKCNALGCTGSDAQTPACDEIPACQVIDPSPAVPAPLLSFPALVLLLLTITGLSARRLRRARS